MANIELTARMRLMIEGLIGQQKGTIDEISVFFDIRKKIAVENRDEFIKTLPNGGVMVDEAFIDSMPSASIDLEKAERKKLLSLINTYSSFSPVDMDWVLPLKRQLELVD
jgi:hypothetical protein